MAGLADKVYIPLVFKDCSYKETATGEKYAFKWYMPNFNARQAPVCYIKLKMVAIEGTTQNARQCLWIRANNLFGENVLINEKQNTTNIGGTILAMLDFRGNTDHYALIPESAIAVQISPNIPYIEFDLIDSTGEVETLDEGDATHTINILLEIIYPEHNKVRDTTLMTYAQSVVGNPPYQKLI